MSSRNGRRTYWTIAACLLVLAAALVSLLRLRRIDSVRLPRGIAQREFELARDSFQLKYGGVPDNTDTLSLLAEILAERGRLPEAVDCFAMIPTAHPKYGRMARYQQGRTLLAMHRAIEAELQLREFIEVGEQSASVEPKFLIDARQRLRHILEVELRFEERHQLLRGMIAREEASSFEAVVACFPSLLRWNGPDAVRWLEEFRESSTTNPVLEIALGRYRTGQGRLREALQILKPVALAPSSSLSAKAAYLACLCESAELDAADRLIESCPPQANDDPWQMLLQRGSYAIRTDRPERAIAAYEQLLQQDRSCIEAWQGIVHAARILGDEQRLHQAAKMVSVLARLQSHLGKCIQEADNPDSFLDVANLCAEIDFRWQGSVMSRCAQRLSPKSNRAAVAAAPIARRPVAKGESQPNDRSNWTDRQRGDASFVFRDATAEFKVKFTRYDGVRGQNLIQEGPGGGVAVFDYDLDGQLDIFLTQGSRLPRSEMTREFSNELYRNDRPFRRVTESAGLTAYGFHTGVTAGDIDEDGFTDLYVTAYGRASLWHNNGDGTFTEMGAASRTDIDSWTTGAALADLNGDGLLDLFVVGYLVAEDNPPKICREPRSPTGTIQCSPTVFPAADDFLLLNQGDGTFVDSTIEMGIDGRDGKGLGVVIDDFDGDGLPEIFVANDGTPSFLYRRFNESNPQAIANAASPFRECGAEVGVAVNGEGKATAAMGIAHGDYNRDGWIDLFVTNFYLEPNSLFRNDRGHGFSDVSAVSRLGPASRTTLAFGTEFLDIDHDGWLDLVVTTGHVEDRSWLGEDPYRMQPHLFRNERNGRFADVAATSGPYFKSKWIGRGLAIGDLDRDGDVDVVISHQVDPSVVLLNESPAPATSVVIKPIGTGRSPRSGIGVRVTANGVSPILMRTVAGGGSFQSASALELHFGLNDQPELNDLECTWPDGGVEHWTKVQPGYYIAVEGFGLRKLEKP